MNKSELVAELAKRNDLSKASAEQAIDSIVDIITAELVKGEEVAIHGLGTFRVAERAERQGHNPKTGEKLTIPAAKVAKFKPAKALRDAVDN